VGRAAARDVHDDARMKTTSTVLGAALTVALVVACGSQNAESYPNATGNSALGSEPGLGVTSAQKGFDPKTIDLIADARCDRAEECSEIGAGRKYATRAVCDQLILPRTSSELSSTSCAHGVDHDAVSRCVTAINRERCATHLETVSRIVDCRADRLCTR
jgi:hypothetical protein